MWSKDSIKTGVRVPAVASFLERGSTWPRGCQIVV